MPRQHTAETGRWLRLVEARQTAGLTQAEVARRLGVSQTQVARLVERGYRVMPILGLRTMLTCYHESDLIDDAQYHRVMDYLSDQQQRAEAEGA